MKLKTYTEEGIPVLGRLNIHVSNGTQKAQLVVVAGDGLTLLGRNWLKYIRLDWKSIHQIAVDDTTPRELTTLLNKFEELFSSELRTIKNY